VTKALFCFALTTSAAFLFAAAQVTHPEPVPATAQSWAKAVADFVTSPDFFHEVPDTVLTRRLNTLLPSANLTLDDSSGTGANPAMGITSMTINLNASSRKGFHAIAQAHFSLQDTDSHGAAVYPILRSKLRARLQKPLWSCVAEGNWNFWRKGRTNQFIQIDSGPGSSVTVDAGREEGDSEGDEHPKPCRE